MGLVKSIHHIAVVVADMEKSLSFWRDALGMELRELQDVPAENSRVAFLPAGDSQIELVLPTRDDSGIGRYLAKRGPGMHHVCVQVDDIDEMLSQLKAHGTRLINEEPQVGADGQRYAFVHPEASGGVLVELYES
jgi:methylmalonyl-CoA/ethylmalonyl-CoA epimerase